MFFYIHRRAPYPFEKLKIWLEIGEEPIEIGSRGRTFRDRQQIGEAGLVSLDGADRVPSFHMGGQSSSRQASPVLTVVFYLKTIDILILGERYLPYFTAVQGAYEL